MNADDTLWRACPLIKPWRSSPPACTSAMPLTRARCGRHVMPMRTHLIMTCAYVLAGSFTLEQPPKLQVHAHTPQGLERALREVITNPCITKWFSSMRHTVLQARDRLGATHTRERPGDRVQYSGHEMSAFTLRTQVLTHDRLACTPIQSNMRIESCMHDPYVKETSEIGRMQSLGHASLSRARGILLTTILAL